MHGDAKGREIISGLISVGAGVSVVELSGRDRLP